MTTTDHLGRAERLALCDTFDRLGPDAPTLCDPWDARMLAAHLVLRERRPDLAAGILVPFLADRLDRHQSRLAEESDWPALIDLVRTGPPVWSPTRVGAVDDIVNTIEMVVHHEDVLRGDGARGPRRELPARLENAVWSSLRRTASLMVRRAPVGVELEWPGHGVITARQAEPMVRVTGAPVELLLLAYGRERVAEIEYVGPQEAVESLRGASLGL